MLKSSTQNKHATLLSYFMNSVHQSTTPQDQFNEEDMKADFERLKPYMNLHPVSLMGGGGYSPDLMRLFSARSLVQDNNRFFERYMKQESRVACLFWVLLLSMGPKL